MTHDQVANLVNTVPRLCLGYLPSDTEEFSYVYPLCGRNLNDLVLMHTMKGVERTIVCDVCGQSHTFNLPDIK